MCHWKLHTFTQKKGKGNQVMWGKALEMEFLDILSISSPVASWLLHAKSQCSPKYGTLTGLRK